MSGMSFASITFAAGNFTLGGDSVTLTSGVTVNSGVSGSSISLPITLSGANAFNIYGPSLSDSGVISGGSLTVFGSGSLTLDGADASAAQARLPPAARSISAAA